MLFGPALVSPGVYHRQRMFLAVVSFIAGKQRLWTICSISHQCDRGILNPSLFYLYPPLKLHALVMDVYTGPILAFVWSYAAAGEAYRFEWPALWCAYSFFQCVFAATFELVTHMTDAKQIGTEGNATYHYMVAEGTLYDQCEVEKRTNGNKKLA
jgi:hypothetical protein